MAQIIVSGSVMSNVEAIVEIPDDMDPYTFQDDLTTGKHQPLLDLMAQRGAVSILNSGDVDISDVDTWGGIMITPSDAKLENDTITIIDPEREGEMPKGFPLKTWDLLVEHFGEGASTAAWIVHDTYLK